MFTCEKNLYNLSSGYLDGLEVLGAVVKNCETVGNRQLDRGPCGKIVQGDPDDPSGELAAEEMPRQSTPRSQGR